MATIKQIAELAGVSRGTVDRVLNNRGAVHPATASKIHEIIKALDYSPNKAAQRLAIKKKGLILGVVIFDPEGKNPFFEDVLTGIHQKTEELSEYGVRVLVLRSRLDDATQQAELLDQLAEQGAAGIAITPVNHPLVADKLRELSLQGIPAVTMNSDIENAARIAYVGSNYYQSGRTAGELMGLLTGGRGCVGIVTGSSQVLCHSERVRGFRDVISDFPGLHVLEPVKNHDDDFESFEAVRGLLERHPKIDALFLAAAGVYGACRAVTSLNRENTIRILSFDGASATRDLIEKRIICATIEQQPLRQGSKPLELLFSALALDIPPAQEYYYTTIDIRLRENMDYN